MLAGSRPVQDIVPGSRPHCSSVVCSIVACCRMSSSAMASKQLLDFFWSQGDSAPCLWSMVPRSGDPRSEVDLIIRSMATQRQPRPFQDNLAFSRSDGSFVAQAEEAAPQPAENETTDTASPSLAQVLYRVQEQFVCAVFFP